MTETVSVVERREAIESAIAMVEAAYEDCAAWCEHLAGAANGGLPAFDAKQRMLVESLLTHVAGSIRKKGAEVRTAMGLINDACAQVRQ